MKKIILILLTLSLTIVVLFSYQKAHAVTLTSAPYDTYTRRPKGDVVLTQTAYEPAGVLTTSTSLKNPQDLFIKDDILYVADTGNKRVLKISKNGSSEVLIDNLDEPTGVHVDENNQLYIVDNAKRSILIYDENLNLKLTIDRPSEPIFGINTQFIPLKLTTGPRGIIYVIGEGSVSGVMQFNYQGEFLGYLATNPTNSSLYRKILEFFNQNLAPITPISPDNLAVDAKGSIYTVSRTQENQLKKFNIASRIVLNPTNYVEDILSSVYINSFGNIITLSQSGIIQEYDATGNLLFTFGGNSTTPILGLFSKAQDLVADSMNNLYVLDQDQGSIQILAKSEFAAIVHSGLQSLNNGDYNVEQWQNVLRMNSVFALANSIIAKTYFRTGDYETALDYYEIANDRMGYSDAFWQVRNNWLQSNLGLLIVLLGIFFVVRFILIKVDKHYLIFNPLRKVDKKLNEVKVIKELRYGKKVLKHPIDTFHELKHQKKSSVKTAVVIFLLFIILNIVAIYTTGFIFNQTDLESYNIVTSFISISGIILLFIFANYLISSLFNGEGWFKDIFIGTAYALIPYLLLTIPIIILSHIFTMNEVFILTSLITLRDAWVLILLVLMIMETHNYSFKELFKNIILTIFTIALLIAIILLVYLLVSQMYDYFASIIREVINRVFN